MSMFLFCSFSGANIPNNLYLEENRNKYFHFGHKKPPPGSLNSLHLAPDGRLSLNPSKSSDLQTSM